MYGKIENWRIIKFRIPLEINNITQIPKFYLVFYDKKKEILASQGWFSHIPRIINGYYISESYILKQDDKRFDIYQYNKSVEIDFEKKYCWELQKRNKSNINLFYRRRVRLWIEFIVSWKY